MEDRGIVVAIRKRPLGRKESAKGDVDIVERASAEDVVVSETRFKVDLTKYVERHTFTFDAVFDEHSDNADIYRALVRPLVASAFNRGKVNCFAYGQTGSGKTYTMMGDPQNDVPGLYLLAAQDVFAQLLADEGNELTVGISFYEIYCGKAYDLLNGREPCFIRVDARENVNIVNLTEKPISNTQSLMALIYYGLSVRITGQTGANDESSRSHAILQINLRGAQGKLFGRMSFIDLAGSERGADVTDTNKQTRLDGAEINKSLLALKECIRALDQNKSYLPFRGSKLTMVLKDSFVGNSRSVMIGNISPSSGSSEHTLNTLRYADRVKELKRGRDRPPEKDQKDELAQQLMLPRLNKNSCRVDAPPDAEEPPEPPEAKGQPPKPAGRQAGASEAMRNSSLCASARPARPLLQRKPSAAANGDKASLLELHHKHVDALVALIRSDLEMVNAAKKSEGDLAEYIERVQVLLEEKQRALNDFKQSLRSFKSDRRAQIRANSQLQDEDLLNLTEHDDELL